LGRIETLYQSYRDRAQFFLVYAREAGHAIPGMAAVDHEVGVFPDTPDGKLHRIQEGKRVFGLTLPCLLDPGERASKAFQGFPARIVVLGTDGCVAVDSGSASPAGLSLRAVEAWLKRQRAEVTPAAG
jgi:hypothetical protein